MPRGAALACEVAIYKSSMHLVGLKGVIQETPLGAPYTLTFPDQALNRFTLNPQGSGIRQEMGRLSVILGPLLIKESLPRPNKGVEVHNRTRVCRASLVVLVLKNLPATRRGFDPWVRKIPWRRA